MPIGPQKTRARIIWIVRAGAVAGVDYQPDRVAEFWKITTEQDWKLCEDNQKGINSSRYEPGPLSETMEAGVDYFDRWYIKELMQGEVQRRLQPHVAPRKIERKLRADTIHEA
jgi:Rieske 2Fe-2S family protein